MTERPKAWMSYLLRGESKFDTCILFFFNYFSSVKRLVAYNSPSNVDSFSVKVLNQITHLHSQYIHCSSDKQAGLLKNRK